MRFCIFYVSQQPIKAPNQFMKEKNSVSLLTAHRVKNGSKIFRSLYLFSVLEAINLARCKNDRGTSLQIELLIPWRRSLLEQCCDTSTIEPKCELVLVYSVIRPSNQPTPFPLFQQLLYLRQTKRCRLQFTGVTVPP